MFQVYHGLLFGLPISVTSFNRWSKFAEALVRRLLPMLFSMYYDDATLQDWASTGVRGQALVAELMELLVSPWAPHKTEHCKIEVDLLGLQHGCSCAHLGELTFWPRQALVDEVNIIEIAEEAGLPVGSKLYWVCTFLQTGHLVGLAERVCRPYSRGSMKMRLRLPSPAPVPSPSPF